MNRQPFCVPPRQWTSKLSRGWMRVWRPLRRRRMRREQQLMQVDVQGLHHVRDALAQEHGVLITPNHPGHADSYVMYESADQLGSPYYFMTAWQVFERNTLLGRRVLQHHGCFSVDREGVDRTAFRQAVEVLEEAQHPLVVFPEGEVYHLNDRVTPFRDGPSTMAITASRRGGRPVACIPCAIKYHYLEDPTPELLTLMDRLERHLLWRPAPDRPLVERVYRFAEGALALKELEYLGETQGGPLPARVTRLIEAVLARIEVKHRPSQGATPERVKTLRQTVIEKLHALPEDSTAGADRRALSRDLDDLFLVIQLYSYPGTYVHERPTIERIAETLDKFEEDALGATTAGIRARRRATLEFGPPILVGKEHTRHGRKGITLLTGQLEEKVQTLLNGLELAPALAPLATPRVTNVPGTLSMAC